MKLAGLAPCSRYVEISPGGQQSTPTWELLNGEQTHLLTRYLGMYLGTSNIHRHLFTCWPGHCSLLVVVI